MNWLVHLGGSSPTSLHGFNLVRDKMLDMSKATLTNTTKDYLDPLTIPTRAISIYFLQAQHTAENEYPGAT